MMSLTSAWCLFRTEPDGSGVAHQWLGRDLSADEWSRQLERRLLSLGPYSRGVVSCADLITLYFVCDVYTLIAVLFTSFSLSLICRVLVYPRSLLTPSTSCMSPYHTSDINILVGTR